MSRKNLLIGITGSIAAKKSSKLIELLKEYFNIKIIVTYEGSNYIDKDYFAKLDTYLSTNSVINTNNCIISVCQSKYKNKLIVLSAIDNLIKGGSGQAVQNMNILYNFKENEGLSVKK